MADDVKTHPVQRCQKPTWMKATAPVVVTERAYEVYSHLHGTSQSLERMAERGGFGTGDIAAFLYARSFPKTEWSARVDEALRGMENF